MTEDAALQLALNHYRSLFAGGVWADVSAAWQVEYDAVSRGAFSSVLILGGSFEGGNASARGNFEQPIRLRALQLRRAEMDAAYAAILSVPAAPTVMYPVFGPGCFPH